MEPLFQNKCKYSKTILLEMLKKTRKKLHIIICICILVYCFGAAIYCIYLNSIWGSGISFLLTAFFILLYLYLPYYNVNKMIRRYYELYHAEVETATYFFGDYILGINKQTNGETKTDDKQIIKIVKTKNLYLMLMKEQLVILVDKNGFVKGNKDEFEEFIKEKAVYAKIRL